MQRSTDDRRAEGRDRGASLILALILLTLGAFLVGSLATSATTNLAGANSLINTRAAEYAADGGMEGAIQQARYGTCGAFPSSGSLILSGYYVYVSCTALTPVSASVTAGSSVATGSAFFPEMAQLGAFNPSAVPLGTTVSSVQSPTQLTLSHNATAAGTVQIGTGFQRLVQLDACVATAAISSCSASPKITAVVLVGDIAPTSDGKSTQIETGYNVAVKRWVVTDVNG